MKLGYLCVYGQEEVARAARLGFDCLELHAASICKDLTDRPKARAAAKEARTVLRDYDVSVSAVSYYANVLAGEPKLERSKFASVFAVAAVLDVDTVAVLAGSVPDEGTEDNLKRFGKVFAPIAKSAERAGVKLAVENWPGFGGELPLKSTNLARSPALWRRMFELVDSDALGLEFDPSHLVRIGVDYLSALSDFGPRVYHVHAKDTELLYDSIAEHGYYGGRPFRYRIPGYGEVDWPGFISGLVEIGYDGGVAIEHEDPVFSGERFEEGLVRGYDVLRPLIQPC